MDSSFNVKSMEDQLLRGEGREPPLAKMTQAGLNNIKTAVVQMVEGTKTTWRSLGHDMGDFLFPGLKVKTPGAHVLLWFVLFLAAFLFEASKMYVAKVQRDANKRKYTRTCVSNYDVFMKIHQTLTGVVHSVAGYLLMSAIMVYIHLLVPVVLGMMLGYFVFGLRQLRIKMQCFCGCVPKCTPECDAAGGDRCTQALCDTNECSQDLLRRIEMEKQKSSSHCRSQLLNRMEEIELRQTNLQPDLFPYEGQQLKSSRSYCGPPRTSLEIYPCAHESKPKISSTHASVFIMPAKAESLPRLASKPDQCELHPEYYYTCDQGHLHHYPQFCPHFMKNKF